MKDPLAGMREAINRGDVDHLAWTDVGKGCPVEVGQCFALRVCWIEITRRERKRSDGEFIWLAFFNRVFHNADKVNLLDRVGGAYTDDVNASIRTHEDPDASTIVLLEPDEAMGIAPRDPPEPEAVPPHEVGTYIGDMVARQRYEHEMTERRIALQQQPLEVRLALVRRAANAAGVDLTRQFASIEQRIKAAESKVLRLSEKASDRAA